MSSNISVGHDKFTVEFLKTFWNKTSSFVVRSLNYEYKVGELSSTQKQRNVTCIFKEGKEQILPWLLETHLR